jgi:hypothetical protein
MAQGHCVASVAVPIEISVIRLSGAPVHNIEGLCVAFVAPVFSVVVARQRPDRKAGSAWRRRDFKVDIESDSTAVKFERERMGDATRDDRQVGAGRHADGSEVFDLDEDAAHLCVGIRDGELELSGGAEFCVQGRGGQDRVLGVPMAALAA